MNEILGMLQKMGTVPMNAMAAVPTIRFRDVLQLMLLSAAVHIVSRAYQVMNRLGLTPALPMQQTSYGYPMQYQQIPMMQNIGYPAQPQMPQVFAYPSNNDEQGGV